MSAFPSEDSSGVEVLGPRSNVIYGRIDWMVGVGKVAGSVCLP